MPSAGVGTWLPRGAWVALALAACGPREVTWERDGVRYTKRTDDATVTSSVLEDLLRHRDVMADYLHLEPPVGSVLRYRKFLDRDDIAKRGHCSAISAGCYFDQFGVESKQALDAHELIHAYTGYLGAKPKIVEEGLAQALSCEVPTIGRVEIAAAMGWSKRAWQSPFFRDIDALYRAGAAFVAYVLQTHGAEQFMRFYASLAAEDELEAASAKFAAMFGSPLEAVWDAALADGGADRGCVYPLRCAEPPLSTEFATHRSDGLTLLRVSPTQPGPLEWRFGVCDTTRIEAAELERSLGGSVRAELADLALGAGRYWFERELITRTTSALADVLGGEHECTKLQPLAVTDRERLLVVSHDSVRRLDTSGKPTPRAGSLILRTNVKPPDSRVRVECSASARVEICESCDYTNCQLVCETGHTSVAIGNGVGVDGGAVLRIQLPAEAGFWLRLRRDEEVPAASDK